MQNNLEDFDTGPPEWYDKELSKIIPIPNNNNYFKVRCNINFGNDKHNDLFCEQFNFKEVNNNFNTLNFKDIKTQNNSDDIKNKIEKLNVSRQKCIEKAKKTNKSESTIIGINTKFDKKIKNINQTTVSRKIRIYPDYKQKKIIKEWLYICKLIYDTCSIIYNSDNSYFNEGFMSVKVDIFNCIFGDNKMNCPYDMATNEIKLFCSNLQSCYSNLKNGNINNFTMGSKNVNKGQTIFVTKKSISKDTIFKNKLGKVEGVKKYFDQFNIDPKNLCDSSLIYDKNLDRYYFNICYNKIKPEKIINRTKAVSLDPGESSFLAFYSDKNFGQIGIHMRTKILKIQEHIKKIQSALNTKKNKDGNKLKNKRKLKKTIIKSYQKIKNLVKELHNKSALFLCKNYERIMIPIFETQKMISNYNEIKSSKKENIDIKNILESNNITDSYEQILKINKLYDEKYIEMNKKVENFINEQDDDFKESVNKIFKKITNEKMEVFIKENNIEKINEIIGIKPKNNNYEEIKSDDIKKTEKIIEQKKKRNKTNKLIFEKIKREYGDLALKEYKKKLRKKIRLNKRVKFVLLNLSHYKFRQHLINKSNEYGCEIIVVTEENTSKTCTNCGNMSKNYNKRIKSCKSCGYKLNRDTTGSRNIYIKNIKKLIK